MRPQQLRALLGSRGPRRLIPRRGVAEAMSTWHSGGAATGDIGFWRQHVQHFRSAKAYALVVGRLLDRQDLVAATALLMQWVSQATNTRLQQGEHSFHSLALRLMLELCQAPARPAADQGRRSTEPRDLIAKFFDYLEANAEEYWQVPSLSLVESSATLAADPDEDDDPQKLFDAAYDEMVYVDSTDDGYEGNIFDSGGSPATEFELEQESRRLRERLAFLATVARLRRVAALHRGPAMGDESLSEEFFDASCSRQKRISGNC